MDLINGGRIFGCLSAKYLLIGVGAVAGAVALSRLIKDAKPLMVGVTKEVIAFNQWLGSTVAEGQEYWEDVAAEAKYKYKEEVEKKLEILQKQQEILMKMKSSLEAK